LNQKDQDRQAQALVKIKEHFTDGMPEEVESLYQVAESNMCWPCVQPYFTALLTACENTSPGWTSAQSAEVREILFEQ